MKKKVSGDGEDGPGHRPRLPGKGKKLWVADELMTFHRREDESFYLLEGEFEFLVGTTGSRPPPAPSSALPKGPCIRSRRQERRSADS
jgi:hypothetical protein